MGGTGAGSSAIGILLGAGLYLPAIGLAALLAISMGVVPHIEHHLLLASRLP